MVSTLYRDNMYYSSRNALVSEWNLWNLWMLCCLSWPERWPWMHPFGPVFLHLWWRTRRSAWPSSLRPPHLPWSSSRCRYDSPPRDPVINMPTQHSQNKIDRFIENENNWKLQPRMTFWDNWENGIISQRSPTVFLSVDLHPQHRSVRKWWHLTSLTVSDREPKVFLNTSEVFTVSASIVFYRRK